MQTRGSARWWALGALVLSGLVIGFDLTILNVALPTLARDLHADTGRQQWIVDAYLVAYAGAMLPAGILGDRLGRKRLLVGGLTVFAGGSLLGALVHTSGPVIAARALMGVGGAVVFPLILSVLPVLFPAPRERSRAVGLVTVAFALGMPIGPILGGTLLDHFWWGSIFLLNLPMLALALIAVALFLPESRDPHAPRVRPVPSALAAGGLVAVVFGIVEAPRRGWGDTVTVAGLAGGAVLIAAFLLLQRASADPMVPPALFRNRGYSWGAIASVLTNFIVSGAFFILPLHLQAVRGDSPLGAGVGMMPMMGGLLVAGLLCDRVVPRFGARWVVAAGLLLAAAASLLGTRTTVGGGYGSLAAWLVLLGAGAGFAMIPSLDAALAALPPNRAGAGSSVFQTLRQTGSALGVALLGSLLSSRYTAHLDVSGVPAAAARAARESVIGAEQAAAALGRPALAAAGRAAFVDGMTAVLAVCGAVALVAGVLVAALMPGGLGRTERGRDNGGHDTAEDSATDVAADPDPDSGLDSGSRTGRTGRGGDRERAAGPGRRPA